MHKGNTSSTKYPFFSTKQEEIKGEGVSEGVYYNLIDLTLIND
jgi:hypothetical protein